MRRNEERTRHGEQLLVSLELWACTAFAASCAERTAPLYRYVLTQPVVERLDRDLGFAWKVAEAGVTTTEVRDEARELHREFHFSLDGLPYAEVWAHRATEPVLFSLMAATELNFGEWAKEASWSTLDVHQAYDQMLVRKGITRMFRADDLPPLDRYAAVELELQIEIAEALRDEARSRRERLAWLKERSHAAKTLGESTARDFLAACSDFFRLFGW